MIPEVDRERLHDFIDGRLDAAEHAKFSSELELRPELRRAHDAIRALRRGLGELRSDSAPGDLRNAVLNAIRSERGATTRGPRRWFSSPWFTTLAAAALAVAAIGFLRDRWIDSEPPKTLADAFKQSEPGNASLERNESASIVERSESASIVERSESASIVERIEANEQPGARNRTRDDSRGNAKSTTSEPRTESTGTPNPEQGIPKHPVPEQPVPDLASSAVAGGLGELAGNAEKLDSDQKPAGVDSEAVKPQSIESSGAPATTAADDSTASAAKESKSKARAADAAGAKAEESKDGAPSAPSTELTKSDGLLEGVAATDGSITDDSVVRVLRVRRSGRGLTTVEAAVLVHDLGERDFLDRKAPATAPPSEASPPLSTAKITNAALADALSERRKLAATSVIEVVGDDAFLAGLLERASAAGVEVSELQETSRQQGTPVASGPGGNGRVSGQPSPPAKSGPATGGGGGGASSQPKKSEEPAAPAAGAAPAPTKSSALAPLVDLVESDWRWISCARPAAPSSAEREGPGRVAGLRGAEKDKKPRSVRFVIVIATDP